MKSILRLSLRQNRKIWAVITDARNYKNWNPVITNVVGTYAEGATIINTVVEDRKKPTEIKSKVVKFEPLSTSTNLVVTEASSPLTTIHPRKS